MAESFSLKDHLFNRDSIGDLAGEMAQGIPGFDAAGFAAQVMSGLAERELLERMDWIADCLEPHLSSDFPTMADQLEAAMPPELDPTLGDDDFGRFIHAVPGILAVRHGLEHHRDRALDLLHAATKRFSMEFYIRPFLNRWPAQTLARLRLWAGDENYHVRRLVSEGTRAKLPWAKKIDLDPMVPLEFLDMLYGDSTRYVTRSVANHMNDIAKIAPDMVVDRLATWQGQGGQSDKEMGWITRHALRTLIKDGHAGALGLLGYRGDVPVTARLDLDAPKVAIGDVLGFTCHLEAAQDLPVLVDYVLTFHTPTGRPRRKVFKMKTARITASTPLNLRKTHRFKGDATTFRLYPGPHHLALQVNGVIVAETVFDLTV